MLPTDSAGFATELTALAEVFGETVSETKLRGYFLALTRYPLVAIRQGCRDAAAESKYFPKPVELRDFAKRHLSSAPQGAGRRALPPAEQAVTDAVAEDVLGHMKPALATVGTGVPFDRAAHRAWIAAMGDRYPTMAWDEEFAGWDTWTARHDANHRRWLQSLIAERRPIPARWLADVAARQTAAAAHSESCDCAACLAPA